MSWGIDGPTVITDGTTFPDRTAPAGVWTVHAPSTMDWFGFNPEFHLYTKNWTGSAWPASWTEVPTNGRPVLRFATHRGVRDWWQGITAGTATIVLDNTLGTPEGYFGMVQRVKLTVDTPAGEQALFSGFISEMGDTYDAAGYPILTLNCLDHFGWSAQSPYTALTGGLRTTGYCLYNMLSTFGAGVETADLAGITTTDGLESQNTIAAGNVINAVNQYLRGELGVLWVDGSGVIQFRPRHWWWDSWESPVAIIGSTDRGSAFPRGDPTYDVGFRFPASYTDWKSELGYSEYRWTRGDGTTPSLGLTTGGIGDRRWADTVYVTQTGDNEGTGVSVGLGVLSAVLSQFPMFRGIYDNSGSVLIHADANLEAMVYAAQADVTDLLEVAKETQIGTEGRSWQMVHVMGVSHTFSPETGWLTRLEVNRSIAHAIEQEFITEP